VLAGGAFFALPGGLFSLIEAARQFHSAAFFPRALQSPALSH